MRFFAGVIPAAAVLFIASTSAVAKPLLGVPIKGRGCINSVSEDLKEAFESNFRAFRALHRGSSFKTDGQIDTYFHVLMRDDSEEGGNLTATAVSSQIDVLNAAYVSTGLHFNLKEVTRTVKPEWFSDASPYNSLQLDMKKALRRGGSRALNVYSVGFENDDSYGLLGYATFPSEYEDAPEDDGVVILHSTTPGGDSAPFNLGHTLTHEVGHWVGLYHTFQGGCGATGDMVDDTPSQAGPSNGCPVGRDSCKDLPGLDPIHNYMDYSHDSCMTEFTPGQADRIRAQLAAYRSEKEAPSPSTPIPSIPVPTIPTPPTSTPTAAPTSIDTPVPTPTDSETVSVPAPTGETSSTTKEGDAEEDETTPGAVAPVQTVTVTHTVREEAECTATPGAQGISFLSGGHRDRGSRAHF